MLCCHAFSRDLSSVSACPIHKHQGKGPSCHSSSIFPREDGGLGLLQLNNGKLKGFHPSPNSNLRLGLSMDLVSPKKTIDTNPSLKNNTTGFQDQNNKYGGCLFRGHLQNGWFPFGFPLQTHTQQKGYTELLVPGKHEAVSQTLVCLCFEPQEPHKEGVPSKTTLDFRQIIWHIPKKTRISSRISCWRVSHSQKLGNLVAVDTLCNKLNSFCGG